MAEKTTGKTTIGGVVEIILPLLILALLIALCVQLLVPFVGLLMWTIILAVCFYPVHKRLRARGMSDRLSASIIGIGLAALILVPTAIAAISAASSVPALVAGLRSGEQHVPPPPAKLADVPLVGAKVHAAWAQAANDMPAFAKQFGPQLANFTKWLVGAAGGMIGAVLALLLAVIFAAITLAYSDAARAFIRSVFARVTGSREKGDHYMDVIGATVRSVANGVIGVAFVQALLCGIGFFLVGIPGAGILSLLAMALGVVQVPVVIVTLPAIIYAFAVKSTTVAIIFLVWFIIAGLSDAVLKPLMIGHGLEVPMPVILLGVIGGVIAYGLVGLFIGAVLLAVGYVLFREWLAATPAATNAKGSGTLQAAE
ncbi:AI-2E family transporter [Sphingomonas hankyongi]|uniref:AI-2E family transporter n=1 Tax=Sphingomonas hankyongi TaxID=2908209 RepID=A0ABT0S2E9_9SPHN|nr:AI-2E family transporter [Sphingomonas hankyongi]MCL6730023.1 AI-2E family transporter [Sphingomonas hankyongi]